MALSAGFFKFKPDPEELVLDEETSIEYKDAVKNYKKLNSGEPLPLDKKLDRDTPQMSPDDYSEDRRQRYDQLAQAYFYIACKKIYSCPPEIKKVEDKEDLSDLEKIHKRILNSKALENIREHIHDFKAYVELVRKLPDLVALKKQYKSYDDLIKAQTDLMKRTNVSLELRDINNAVRAIHHLANLDFDVLYYHALGDAEIEKQEERINRKNHIAALGKEIDEKTKLQSTARMELDACIAEKQQYVSMQQVKTDGFVTYIASITSLRPSQPEDKTQYHEKISEYENKINELERRIELYHEQIQKIRERRIDLLREKHDEETLEYRPPTVPGFSR